MVTVKIEGMENIIAALKQKEGEFVRLLAQGMEDSADYVKELAKQKAPVRTGKLRDAIDKGKLEYFRDRAKIDVGIDSSFPKDGWYARFVEKGTSRTPQQQYLRPAIDESKTRVNTIIANKLKEGLR